MPSLTEVLLLALLPAAGILVGGLVAEVIETTRNRLSLALHASAGVVFAVVALELAPRAFEGAPLSAAALAFFAGGVAYIAIESVTDKLVPGDSAEAKSEMQGAWAIYAAVAVDLFSDGLLVGTGSSISTSLALVLAIGQITANTPEGFATLANFKHKGAPRTRRLLIAASFVIPSVAGALVAYFLLRGRSEALQLSALAFAGGLLLVAAAEEIVREAHDVACDKRWSSLAITAGFVFFALIATYFDA